MYDVCIADDEKLIQQSITARIRESGIPAHVVGCADNAENARSLYWSAKPDIFFVDINMPGTDGLGLVRRIREEDPGCTAKFIIITGYDDFAHMREAIQSGAMDYLKKPISTEEFNKTLASAVNMIRQERRKRISSGDGFVLYENFLDNGNSILKSGTLLALYVPSAEIFAEKELMDKTAASFFTHTKGKPADGSFSLRFQNVHNVMLWYCPERNIPKNAILPIFRGLMKRTNISIVYAHPESDDIVSLTERMEQSMNFRFFHPGLIECIREPVIINLETGVLDYYLENGQIEAAGSAASALVPKTISGEHGAAGLGPVFRQIILLLINKYISHNIPMPVSLKLELSPFALCRFQTLENLKTFLCGAASTLAKNISDQERKSELIQSVIDYIRQNYRKDVSLNYLARQFFVTPPYLSRRFKEKTGLTFIEYLEDIRLEKAEEFLAGSDAKINDISEQVGYMDPNYFAKVFRRKYHLSPSDYRLTRKNTK
ncbi:MAG: response regulator [Treponema sp.]|jgi:two-component system response regulator YesN|nr:response regulator [Treponema sp.]